MKRYNADKMKIAVLFATRGGNTRSVAERIASGLNADLIVDLKENNSVDVSDYDVVILGSGVYSGKPNRIGTFIKKNRNILSSKDVRLFLCCLYGGERGDSQLESISLEWDFLKDKIYFHGKTCPDMSEVDEYISKLKASLN